MNGLLASAASLLLLPVLVIAAAMGGDPAPPSTAALADIPAAYLDLYRQAGAAFGLPWELLAAVGKVESDHGRNPAAYQPNSAGAVGPMQFEPATFAAYSWAAGNPDPSIDDPHDAIFAAAAMLQANGAPGDTQAALYAYNNAGWYVSEVLAWAAAYTSEAAIGASVDSPRAALPPQRPLSATRSPSSAPPTCGAATNPAASTAPGSSRPPTPRPGSPSPASRRPSTTPGRTFRRGSRSSRATSSSSAATRATSTTSGS